MSIASTENELAYAEWIERKHSILLALIDTGEQQRQLIDNCETDGLLRLLADKQSLIAALVEAQDQLKKFAPKDSQWHSQSLKNACDNRATECNALGEKLLASEKASEDAAQLQRDRVAEQLRNFSRISSRKTDDHGTNPETHLAEFDESS